MPKYAVPVVDFAEWEHGSAEDRLSFAKRLGGICHRVGFFTLVGTSLDAKYQKNLLQMMKKLFDLPLKAKQAIEKRHSPHFRGWEALGTERTNGRVDYREQVDTWTDRSPREPRKPYERLYGPSQYFPDKVLPGYKALTLDWRARCRYVCNELLAALALSLGLKESHFRETFGPEETRMSLTKYIHYPGSATGQHGVNAHKDTGFLTLLLPFAPGLEIQHLESGEWFPVEIVPGSIVVNLGEVLQSKTGQYFVATPHRVVTTKERYSCAYFHGPSLDYPMQTKLELDPKFAKAVEASPFHRNAKFMARKEETEQGVGDMESEQCSTTYGEQLWNYFRRAYPQIVESYYGGIDNDNLDAIASAERGSGSKADTVRARL